MKLEAKKADYNSNYILTRLIEGFHKRGTRLLVKYKGKNMIKVKLKKCDFQEFSMFCLGMFKEAFTSSNKDEVYLDAVKEILSELLKECKKY